MMSLDELSFVVGNYNQACQGDDQTPQIEYQGAVEGESRSCSQDMKQIESYFNQNTEKSLMKDTQVAGFLMTNLDQFSADCQVEQTGEFTYSDTE